MAAIAPSILAADFSRLGELVRICEEAGADRIHIDVMDGHFVPNLSMGAVVVEGLRPVTKLVLEVHLMVERPADYIAAFVEAGADTLIVHQEVLPTPIYVLHQIRALGKKVGMAINPSTSVESLAPYLAEIDLALCMTVVPGFGGQAYLSQSPERIAALAALIQQHNPKCELEVDGGIKLETAKLSVKAGANVLVAGSALFKSPLGLAAAIQEMSRETKG